MLLLFTAAVVAWAAVIFIAPLEAHLGTAAYLVGSMICHQIPDRSFHLASAQLPVCARCTGLYVGALTGVIAWFGVSRRAVRSENRDLASVSRAAAPRLLIVAALPTLVSAATAIAGWWDPGNAVRATLAAPLGAAVSAVVAAGLAGELR